MMLHETTPPRPPSPAPPSPAGRARTAAASAAREAVSRILARGRAHASLPRQEEPPSDPTCAAYLEQALGGTNLTPDASAFELGTSTWTVRDGAEFALGLGGSQQHNYMVGQIAAMQVGTHRVGIAAVFSPSQQPPNDDPGQTEAPQALEALFASVANKLPLLEAAR